MNETDSDSKDEWWRLRNQKHPTVTLYYTHLLVGTIGFALGLWYAGALF